MVLNTIEHNPLTYEDHILHHDLLQTSILQLYHELFIFIRHTEEDSLLLERFGWPPYNGHMFNREHASPRML